MLKYAHKKRPTKRADLFSYSIGLTNLVWNAKKGVQMGIIFIVGAIYFTLAISGPVFLITGNHILAGAILSSIFLCLNSILMAFALFFTLKKRGRIISATILIVLLITYVGSLLYGLRVNYQPFIGIAAGTVILTILAGPILTFAVIERTG